MTQPSGGESCRKCHGSEAALVQATPHGGFSPYAELMLRPQLCKESLSHSVYTVKDFGSYSECKALIAAGYRVFESYGRAERYPRERLPIATELDNTLLLRLFTLIEHQLPALCEATFGQAHDLKKMARRFSPGEPAINIYGLGGEFAPHTDKEHLTVLSAWLARPSRAAPAFPHPERRILPR